MGYVTTLITYRSRSTVLEQLLSRPPLLTYNHSIPLTANGPLPYAYNELLIQAIPSSCYKMKPPISALTNGNVITPETIAHQLTNDHKVKVAGIDCDGVLRGKIMSREKFLASLEDGFGMSSAIFAWDMHDMLYVEEGSISSEKDGYGDFIAEVDLSSFRRLPFEDNIPFFLLRFKLNGVPVFADGRSLIQSTAENLARKGMRGLAGGMSRLCLNSSAQANFDTVELEFTNFETPSQDGYGISGGRQNLAGFLDTNPPRALRPLTGGMFGYSVSRPIMTKEYFHSIYNKAKELGCPIEGWHTESGPGVYEAVSSAHRRVRDNQ